MQLLEIKNDLAKIKYNPKEKNFFLADFLIISDDNQNLLAQIIHLESTNIVDVNLCLVKFILSVDTTGSTSAYNGYIPMRNATINHLETKEVVELLKTSKLTMSWGPLAAH